MALPNPSGVNALIFAPYGRDAAVARALLQEAGIDSVICSKVAEFAGALDETAAFAVVTEEALSFSDLTAVASRVAAQPPWSDLPFIVLTHRGGEPDRNPVAARLSDLLGNVTFLERPFRPTTFVSVARTAYKGRQRQYEARDRIKDLQTAQDALRKMNESLEELVSERTVELKRTHAAMLAEVEQRQRTEDLLRQSQKMDMIGQLTGGVAHDFNNLLMVVMSNLELLRKKALHEPSSIRLIDGAMQGAQRGAALTQRLLAFARRQELTVRPRNLLDLIAGMMDLIQRSVGPRIEIRMDLPQTLPPVSVDENQLELAVLNLTVNARDAMPEGGVLAIRAFESAAPPQSELAPGRYVRLAVIDTGCGMDADTLAKAVEPFFSTKELGKGTGLGLSMVHGLALQLGGALRLSSEVGRGTTAEIWLPISEPRVEIAPGTAPPQEETVDYGKVSILVVDDDPLIAMSTADMLADLGHSVIEAHSAETALNILKVRGDIDLLLTDYSMPRMTGAELAKVAHDLRPGLPVLLATGYAELPSGSDLNLPRISKPFLQHQLRAEVAKILSSSRAC